VTGDVYVSSCQISQGPPVKLAVTVISDRTNKVIATIPVWGSVSGVSPVTGDVYLTVSSGGSTLVRVLNGRTNKVIATIHGASAEQMAVSPQAGKVYLPTNSAAHGGRVTVLNGRTNKIAAVIQVDAPAPNPIDGMYTGEIAVSPVTGEIYVGNAGGYHQASTLTVLNGQTNNVIATLDVGGLGTAQIAVGSRTGTVYIANNYTNTMDVISGKTNKVIHTVRFGPVPGDTAFAVSQRTGNAYALGTGEASYPWAVGVSVISATTGKTTATIRFPKAVDDSYQIAVSPVTGDVYTLNPVSVNTLSPYSPWVLSVISG
jgi:DNA-binding beta-propeller fold protein YncE